MSKNDPELVMASLVAARLVITRSGLSNLLGRGRIPGHPRPVWAAGDAATSPLWTRQQREAPAEWYEQRAERNRARRDRGQQAGDWFANFTGEQAGLASEH